MIKKTSLLLLTTLVFGHYFNNSYKTTSAEEKTVNGVKIIYDASAKNSDIAYINVPNDKGQVGVGYSKKYILMGFDAPEIEEINRMHFRITYKDTKSAKGWGGFVNWWNETIVNQPPKYGTLVTSDVSVVSSVNYSLKWDSFPSPNITLARHGRSFFHGEESLKFNAIGKVDDLLKAYESAKTLVNNGEKLYMSLAGFGGYTYRSFDGFYDETKSFNNRQYYAVIPMSWAEEIGPESIDCTLIDGKNISDGLDENGEAFVDAETGEKYIEVTPSKDFGVAINGINAKVKRIKVSGYFGENNIDILLVNAGWNYAEKAITNITNDFLFSKNLEQQLNWSINNQNRYVFIKFNGNTEDAEKIKIRIYYENDNDSNAWLLNVTDKDGNFLPEPIKVPRLEKPQIEFKDLLIIMGVVLIMILIIAVAYDIFKRTLIRSR